MIDPEIPSGEEEGGGEYEEYAIQVYQDYKDALEDEVPELGGFEDVEARCCKMFLEGRL